MRSPIVTILSVGPVEDRKTIKEILAGAHPSVRWQIKSALTAQAAFHEILSGGIALVVWNHDHDAENWRAVPTHAAELRPAPLLIVTSRQADDRLWVEALNLGAYDVLAKPFERNEVIRALTLAAGQWTAREATLPAKSGKVRAAAAGALPAGSDDRSLPPHPASYQAFPLHAAKANS